MSNDIKKKLVGTIITLALFCTASLAMAKNCSPWTCVVDTHQASVVDRT